VTKWEAVKAVWPTADAGEPGLAGTIANIDELLGRIVYHCGVLTIAPRVNKHLQLIKIGRPLNFAKTFSDELPDTDDQQRMLEYLRDHSIAVEGLVDVSLGLIYRASSNLWVRVATYLAIAATAALGVGFVALLAYTRSWLDLSDWPLGRNDFKVMLGVYAFMLLGAVAHIGVDAIKHARAGDASVLSAVDDWPTWIHVKYATLILSVLSIWLGLVGYAFTMQNSDKIDWRAAFFVGYSIDSIIDIFLQRFTTFADSETKALKQTLGSSASA
jgi:hypothetical protein